MAKNIKSTNPVSAISPQAARIAFGAGISFLVLLTLLHILKPELNPSWHFISEYAIGNSGWLMVLAFFTLSAGYAALFLALKSQVQTIGGKIGLALLLISAVGFAIAGIFVTDPIITPPDQRSMTGQLHELGALLDLTPFAAPLIAWSLARHNPNWASAKRALWATAWLPLIGLVVFSGAVALLSPEGKFGSDVLVGWPNRFLIVTYCVWLAVVAWQAIKLRARSS